jgi:pectate lyase
MPWKHPISSTRPDDGLSHRTSRMLFSVVAASIVFVAGCDSREPATAGKAMVPEQRPTNPQQVVLSLESNQIQPEKGLAFAYQAPHLESEADTTGQSTRSPYFLLEDGKPLAPAHAIHEDIRNNGKGRWSHWGKNIYFSSSDGSDPRQNNRKYTLVK